MEELSLEQSLERYRSLFERVPCYVTIQNRELDIVEANRRFREDFGPGRGKCYQVYKHRPSACPDCPVQRTFVDGKVHRSEEVVETLSGERRHVVVYTAPLGVNDGPVGQVMEMSTDISHVRELQSKLESLGMLISSISHGLKGLLTGLDGGIYLVNSGLQKDDRDRIQKGWEMVRRNVERIRSTVMNILYYAKDREPNLGQVEVGALLQDAFSVQQDRATQHAVALELFPPAQPMTFEGDAAALRAMLVNLVENAIDACRVAQKPGGAVKMSASLSRDQVLFEVRDNGIGMDAETRSKVFSLFFSSKGTEGTGLGLFIAEKIARAHGGRIEVESALGEGTCFMVLIPLRPSGR